MQSSIQWLRGYIFSHDTGFTIVDLPCPFFDQGTACILFRNAIDLFLGAHPPRGKTIVADEARKVTGSN